MKVVVDGGDLYGSKKLDLDAKASVAYLKRTIQDEFGIPILQQILLVKDKALINGLQTVEATGASSGSKITLVRRCEPTRKNIPTICKFLASKHPYVREEGVTALGQVAKMSIECRDDILDSGALKTIVALCETEETIGGVIKYCRTISALCGGRPVTNPKSLKPAISLLCKLLCFSEFEILRMSCKTMLLLSNVGDDLGAEVLRDKTNGGPAKRIIELLDHQADDIIILALSLVFNLSVCNPSIATSTPGSPKEGKIVEGKIGRKNSIANIKENLKVFVDAKLVPKLKALVETKTSVDVRTNALKVVSNLVVGEHSRLIIREGIMEAVIRLIKTRNVLSPSQDVIEALWVIVNIACDGQPHEKKKTVDMGGLSILISTLASVDSEVKVMALEGLDHFLTVEDAALQASIKEQFVKEGGTKAVEESARGSFATSDQIPLAKALELLKKHFPDVEKALGADGIGVAKEEDAMEIGRTDDDLDDDEEDDKPDKEGEESIKVVVRCRPFIKNEKNECKDVVFIDNEIRAVMVKDQSHQGFNPEDRKTWRKFTFDTVYDKDSRQKSVYKTSVSKMVRRLLKGFNSTIFAYGQTSSGKTHTMMGVIGDEHHEGITPRIIQSLFNYIEKGREKGNTFLITLSYLEIYNERVYDLLIRQRKKGKFRESLQIRQQKESFVVPKLTKHVVTDDMQMMAFINMGSRNRSTSATSQNSESSRSHSMLIIYIEKGSSNETTGSNKSEGGMRNIVAAKLNLVDLAGSERFQGLNAKMQKESTSINQSLTALANVIAALTSTKKGTFIPYRNSALTKLLRDSLGGNASTLMFANINPCDRNCNETVSTLRYASRAKKIKNKPKVNQNPKDALLTKLQGEIKNLRKLLEEKDKHIERIGTTTSPTRLPIAATPTKSPEDLEAEKIEQQRHREFVEQVRQDLLSRLNDAKHAFIQGGSINKARAASPAALGHRREQSAGARSKRPIPARRRMTVMGTRAIEDAKKVGVIDEDDDDDDDAEDMLGSRSSLGGLDIPSSPRARRSPRAGRSTRAKDVFGADSQGSPRSPRSPRSPTSPQERASDEGQRSRNSPPSPLMGRRGLRGTGDGGGRSVRSRHARAGMRRTSIAELIPKKVVTDEIQAGVFKAMRKMRRSKQKYMSQTIDLKNVLKGVSQKNDDLEERVTELEQKLMAAESQSNDLENMLENAREHEDELIRELDELQNVSKKTDQQLKHAQDSIRTLEDEKKKIEDDLKIQKAIAKSKTSVDSFNPLSGDFKGTSKAVTEVEVSLAVEIRAYAQYVNVVLGAHALLISTRSVPIDPISPDDFMSKFLDGIIPGVLINLAVPNTIDDRALNTEPPLSQKQRRENLTLVFESCKAIGVDLGGLSVDSLIPPERDPDAPPAAGLLGIIQEGNSKAENQKQVFGLAGKNADSVAACCSLAFRLLEFAMAPRAELLLHPDVLRTGIRQDEDSMDDLLSGQIINKWANHMLQDLVNDCKGVVGHLLKIRELKVPLQDDAIAKGRSRWAICNNLQGVMTVALTLRLSGSLMASRIATSLLYTKTNVATDQLIAPKAFLQASGVVPTQALPFIVEKSEQISHQSLGRVGLLFCAAVLRHSFLLRYQAEREVFARQLKAHEENVKQKLALAFNQIKKIRHNSEASKTNEDDVKALRASTVGSKSDHVMSEEELKNALKTDLPALPLSANPTGIMRTSKDDDKPQHTRDAREKQLLRMWVNNMGVENKYIHRLLPACANGVVLLRILDKLSGGKIVNWKKAYQKPGNRFRELANCSYLIDICKAKPFSFKIGTTTGSDINERSPKHVLSVIWQLMQYHMFTLLKTIYVKKFGSVSLFTSSKKTRKRSSKSKSLRRGGIEIDEEKIVQWSVSTVLTSLDVANGAPDSASHLELDIAADIKSFDDKSIANSHFLLLLLWAKDTKRVNWKAVAPGETEDDCFANARYAISIARKLGTTIFLLPQDIVEVRPKMILTFVGAVLGLENHPRTLET